MKERVFPVSAHEKTTYDGYVESNAPWDPYRTPWSKEQFREFVDYVRSKGMEFVPEFKLLTHQEKFFQDNYTDLMFNSATYDPTKVDYAQHVFS